MAIALAPDAPGQVIPLQLGEKQYRLNDGAFLALDGTAYYTMERQSVGKAIFGGQGGLFVMTTQGQGTLLANAFGSIKRIELHNQEVTIDNAHVVAWSQSLNYNIHLENGFWQSIGTGEGVVNTFQGTGEVYVQSPIFKPLQAHSARYPKKLITNKTRTENQIRCWV